MFVIPTTAGRGRPQNHWRDPTTNRLVVGLARAANGSFYAIGSKPRKFFGIHPMTATTRFYRWQAKRKD